MIDDDKSVEKSIDENEQRPTSQVCVKRKRKKLDILFLLDTTSTMRPVLDCLTNAIAKVLCKPVEYKVDWRVAVWSYCNPQIGVHWLKRNPSLHHQGNGHVGQSRRKHFLLWFGIRSGGYATILPFAESEKNP